MNRWVGRWIVFVGLIHCLFGAVVFFEPLSEIVNDNVWNAVDGHPGRSLAFWFEFLGLLVVLFGAMTDWIEKERGEFPAFVGYGFLVLTVLGVVTMPLGGGWLMIPGAVGLLLKRVRRRTSIVT